MNFPDFYLYRLYRRIKLSIFDKKRILRLQALIEKGSISTAKEYLQLLLRQTKTDRYSMALCLNSGYYKNPQTFGIFLEEFIHSTGSSCGHGKYNSEYSPIYWMGFINGTKFECRFFLNAFCFLKSSFSLELEIEQKEGTHSLKDINYTQLPDSNPNCFLYSLPVHFRKYSDTDHQICFSLIISSPCHVKIYHCTKTGIRSLILQENLNISLTQLE